MKLIAALLALAVSCGPSSVQPSPEGACLYELGDTDAGTRFRTRTFTHYSDCFQYQTLCNATTTRCTVCCSSCEP